MTLIYTEKPELKALGLVKDKSDAIELIARNLATAEIREEAAREAAEARGGAVATVGRTRWLSAKIQDIDLDPNNPTWEEVVTFIPALRNIGR